ncbi:hypothetical protein SD80_019625, partial [Scytonema tolypothrichoides VB-61278]
MHGHTAGVESLAFTSDSRSLLSGGEDRTLRVWDVVSEQCVRTIAGHSVALYDLDWSPEGTHLVSGGADGQVLCWDLRGATPPRVLHAQNWSVFAA